MSNSINNLMYTFTNFIDLSIESLKISTSRLSEIIYCFKKLNIYDLDNLKLLIEYIKSIYSKTLINIERNEKESFLNILYGMTPKK